jgi:5-methylcytosine-specific restriction enzyme A
MLRPTRPALHPPRASRRTPSGTARQRGYGTAHQRFREAVLTRDPVCVDCGTALSRVANHYPLSRRQLVAAGLDPDHGRGVCKPCPDKHTANAQPGGWNVR